MAYIWMLLSKMADIAQVSEFFVDHGSRVTSLLFIASVFLHFVTEHGGIANFPVGAFMIFVRLSVGVVVGLIAAVVWRVFMTVTLGNDGVGVQMPLTFMMMLCGAFFFNFTKRGRTLTPVIFLVILIFVLVFADRMPHAY